MEVEVHISCMDHQAPLANHESCNTADVSIAFLRVLREY